MKKFFTISEFAKLRNININSLRYYEKIGLLKPVYVAPETNYRYYSAEQLSDLDTILLCIQLGIPLKDFVKYINKQGELQTRKLLEDGKKLAQKKMNDIQRGLKNIEYCLSYMDINRQYENRKGTYIRHIGQRWLVTAEYIGEIEDVANVEKSLSWLYEFAQSKNLSPVFPSGIILKYVDKTPKFWLFFDILACKTDETGIMSLPEADFLCLQVNTDSGKNTLEEIEQNFRQKGKDGLFIISNMFLSKYRFRNKCSEIQLQVDCAEIKV